MCRTLSLQFQITLLQLLQVSTTLKAGSQVTTESLYPCGSVTKPYTAVAAICGLFTRESWTWTPLCIHCCTPRLQRQSTPTMLLQLWNNDSTIENVTSRHLHGMQAGFSDYNNGALKNWTINNPEGSNLSMDFVRQLNKAFLFKPEQGAAYSGIHKC